MTTVDARDFSEGIEATADATYISAISTGGGGYEARLEDLLALLEDEEDIREGLIALADEEGTITWEHYKQNRAR